MADLQAAKRYAQAAFELAVSEKALDKWRSELDDIAQVLAESPVAPLLGDARIALPKRLEIVDRLLDVGPLALNLAKLLVSKGRSADARAVEQAFSEMADEYEGIANAEIITAVVLPPERLTAIQSQLSKSLRKRVRATATVNPAILGGVIVRVGDHIVDGSIRTRLAQLRKQLEGVR